jgi:hypothetical protein
MKSLELVLADWRERASGARRVKDERVADLLDELCSEVDAATEDYQKWLSESDAMLRSGKGRYWLRARFGEWAHNDLARWNPKNTKAREYRAMVVPQRSDWAAIQADARRAARGEEGAA